MMPKRNQPWHSEHSLSMQFDMALSAHFWAFRISAYLLENVLDDPAWMALIFC